MREIEIHAIAFAIAILGPLINIWVRPLYSPYNVNSYVYWIVALSIYIGLLLPFVRKHLITMVRLVIFGITAEDFFSTMWKSFFTGSGFLPFSNWYAQYFPFFDILGEPTPFILVPKWYLLAVLAYVLLTLLQYRKQVLGRLKLSWHFRSFAEEKFGK